MKKNEGAALKQLPDSLFQYIISYCSLHSCFYSPVFEHYKSRNNIRSIFHRQIRTFLNFHFTKFHFFPLPFLYILCHWLRHCTFWTPGRIKHNHHRKLCLIYFSLEISLCQMQHLFPFQPVSIWNLISGILHPKIYAGSRSWDFSFLSSTACSTALTFFVQIFFVPYA